jgi:hypothetical protein
VSLSTTGQFQTAVTSKQIFTSSDFGNTWTAVGSTPGAFDGTHGTVSVSGSGQYQTAVAQYMPNDQFGIYISSNFGATWALQKSVSADSSCFRATVSLASSGEQQTAVFTSRTLADTIVMQIFQSLDFGKTWAVQGAAQRGNSMGVSLSATGQFQVNALLTQGSSDGLIYLSADYGKSWTVASGTTSHRWTAVSQSGAGRYITAACEGSHQGIYVSSNQGLSWTKAAIPGDVSFIGANATRHDFSASEVLKEQF